MNYDTETMRTNTRKAAATRIVQELKDATKPFLDEKPAIDGWETNYGAVRKAGEHFRRTILPYTTRAYLSGAQFILEYPHGSSFNPEVASRLIDLADRAAWHPDEDASKLFREIKATIRAYEKEMGIYEPTFFDKLLDFFLGEECTTVQFEI
jgi:hypothetical protein